MSIVIYGPQGSGKTRHAEQLRKFFSMTKVIDLGCGCEDHEALRIYERLMRPAYAHAFEKGSLLILTNEGPPDRLVNTRHVLHIDQALRQAGLKA